jgi:hypothetical protein
MFYDPAFSNLLDNANYFSFYLLQLTLPVLYIVGGWRSWRRARQVLSGSYHYR